MPSAAHLPGRCRSAMLLLALVGCQSKPATTETAAPTAAPTAPAPVAAAAPAPAAPPDTLATFSWDEEMCRYTGRYDTRRYSRQQLLDTHELLTSGSLHTSATPFKTEDIATLSLDTLEAEYTTARARLQQLQLVAGATWQTLRQQKIRSLDDQYHATRLTMVAYTTPEAALKSAYPAACKAYVRGLAAHNDSLIRHDWQALVREQQQHNSVPASLQAEFERQAAAPNWREHAQLALLGFGWWNCLNNTIQRVETSEKTRRQYQQLFTNLQTECEDVD